MQTKDVTENAVTVIIGQHIRPGADKDFLTWQHGLNDAASCYPGFIDAEVTPPTDDRSEWMVIYRFDSAANLRAWLNSATRLERLASGEQYLDGPATQQIVGGATPAVDQLVTVVVTHRVRHEDVEAFLAWQKRLRLAESKFHGYRGTELFRPIDGVQDDWTAVYRYNNAADLEVWLTSDERRRLLEEGKKFHDFKLRTVDNSFGSWFAFDDEGNDAPPPSETKTSIAVWIGLYPTVTLLTLALTPLKVPVWLGLLVGTLLSSFAVSFVTMPYYVNPLLKHWLRPPADQSRSRTNLRAAAIIIAATVFWAVAFYLLAKQFPGLP
jgi:antibiotic biosynthesis monooxygenase (ABM) superfamily enzyme